MKIEASQRLYVFATSVNWFQIRLKEPLAKKLRKPLGYTIWCYRRANGTYDVFGNSQHGPYLTGLTDADMKAGAESVRSATGKLRIASPAELKNIKDNLDWFLEK